MSSAQAAGGPWPGAHEYKRAAREAFKALTDAFDDMGRRHHHHEHRQRGRRGGPGGQFPFDFGRGGPFGPGGPFGGPGGPFGGGHRGWGGRTRKAKRGDVRAAILALLSEEPRNGYQIIQEIAERSEGGWKPSPGAVYPALQQLTDEGLVIAEENEGRKTFRLTDAGLNYIETHADEVRSPWDEMRPDIDDNTADLWHIARQSAFAMMQVLQTGNDAQIREARKTLVETRRKLYQILADGEPGEE
ncbi:DNA-binding transcriptional regulator, PadR family [Nonomuraea solani]|uniref:DNA-binding transcriptional regulator, PadR family n=1 Tax=Nonomuraea solani TaxID=1144553 RepID=A0A1H5ZI80_9ACTN|nr:PadR family transcriptional regulator [Nonomuraea solani]SEG36159.1 DNA-binding transcriptional regulator, PadR family [Nonomuraea solani]